MISLYSIHQLFRGVSVFLIVILFSQYELHAQCGNNNIFWADQGSLSCGASGSVGVGSGTYVEFDVVSGGTYSFNTCGSGWDTELTGYNNTGTAVQFYNDDANGSCTNCTSPACGSGTSPSNLTWTSNFTGVLRVVVDRYSCRVCGGAGGYDCAADGSVVLSYSRANNIPAQPGAISGLTSVCAGSTTTYSISAVTYATSYNWSLPAGWSGSSTSTSITVTAPASASSGNISVTASSPCGTSSARTLAISSTAGHANDNCAGATALTIGGSAVTGNVACAAAGSGACSGSSNYDLWYKFTTLCSGNYQVLVDPSNSFDAVFQVYSSCGGSNISPYSGTAGSVACVDYGGDNSNEYANYSLGAGTYYIRVYDYNSSGTAYPATTTFDVSVSALNLSIPGTPGAISGPVSLCPGASTTYSVSAVSGATSYTWSLPGGWSGSSTSNSINVTASGSVGSGTISVTANNACGSSGVRTISVQSGPVPIANAGTDVTKDCAGSVTLGASSNPETIMTEDFGNAHTELSASSSGWRLYYLYSSHPANRTEWWISNSANGYSCAVNGSSLAQFDTDSQYGPIKCDYAWDDGAMDEIAYNTSEIDALLYTHVYIDFDYIVSGEESSGTVYDYMQIVYSTDGGSTWVSVNAGNNTGGYTYNNNRGVNNGYFSNSPTLSHAHVELPSVLAGNKFLIGFRWYNDGATGYIPGMVVDNIEITGVADYAWSGGSIAFGADTKTPVVTSAGTYTVTVTAGNGCTASDQVVVSQGSLSVDVAAENALTCTDDASLTYTNANGGDQTWIASALSGATSGVTIHNNATYTGGKLRLTAASGGQNGAAFINNTNNFNAGQFDLDFDLYMGGGTGADGFSVSYAGNISSTPGGTESGIGNGLIVSFDSYDNGAGGYQWSGNNTPGIFLIYNGTVLAHSAGTTWRGDWRRVNMSVSSSNVFTLDVDGTNMITYNLGSTAYASANKTGWDFALAARTGGAYDEHSVRNLLLSVYDQFEYALTPTWSTTSTYDPVTAGTYTPGVRLKGGVCTETYSNVTLTEPPAIDAVPTVDNTSPVCLGNTVDLTAEGLAPSGKVLNVTGTNRMGGNMLTSASNNFTIEFWVKPTRTMNVAATEVNSGVGFALNNTELNLAVYPEHGSANAGAGVSVGTNGIAVVEHGSGHFPALLVYPMSITDWTHIAVVYNNRTPTLYVNGNFVKTGLQSSRSTVYPCTGTGQGYGYFNGELDNLRVWNSSRSSSQIRSNMYLEQPGSTSGLIGHYTFNNSNTNATVGPNNSNSGCTFADAAFYTYTWAGTFAPSPANTTETRTSGALTTSGSTNISVTATAAGCASNGAGTSTVTVDGPSVAAVNAAVSPAPAMTANDFLWAGSTNTNWSVASNWYQYNGSGFVTTASVPASNRDVYIVDAGTTNCISVGNTATVNTTSNSAATYIGSGATLTFGNAQILQVYGDFRNYGSLVNNGTSRIRFRGGNTQNIYSGGTASNKRFAILEVNKTGGSVVPHNDMHMAYDMILTAGTWDNSVNNNTLYLERNWTNNAGVFIPGTSTVHFTGTGTQSIKSLWSSGTNNSFYNLTINNSGTGSVRMTDDANILNLTNILDGKFDVQTFTGHSELLNVANGAEMEIDAGGRMNIND